MKKVLALTLGLLFSFSVFGNAQAANAASENIYDNGNVFSTAQAAKVSEALSAADDKYGLVFAIDTVSSLKGQSIDTYALTRANELKVGDVTSSNGVLLVIDKNDHLVRFELGSGVSKQVSNAEAEDVINHSILPHFRENDFTTGSTEGVKGIGEEYVGTAAVTKAAETDPVFHIFLVSVAAIVGFILLLILIGTGRAITRAVQEARKQKGDRAFSDLVESILPELRTARHAIVVGRVDPEGENLSTEHKLFYAADETERKAIILPLVEQHISRRTKKINRDEVAHVVQLAYVHELFSTVADVKIGNPTFSVKAFLNSRRGMNTMSFAALLDEFKDACSADKKRMAKAEADREALRQKNEKERLKKEKAAKRAWSKIPATEKAKIAAASGGVEGKRQAIRNALAEAQKHAEKNQPSSYSPDVLFPMVFSLFTSENSSTHGSSSHSSSSSASSHSHSDGGSYSSSSDSGSYGGSFDGGGASGSW